MDNTTEQIDVLRQDADIEQQGGSWVKSRLIRGIAAITAGAALALGVAAPPAQAADNDQYADVALNVLGALLTAAEGGLTPGEIIGVVQLLRGAVDELKVDVVARLDAQVVVELRAKVDSTLAKTHFLSHGFPWDVSNFNNSAHDAAYLARRHVLDNVLTADKDVDAVGRAMMTLFTSYEVGLAKAGFPEEVRNRVFADYRLGLERLIAKMEPHCNGYADARREVIHHDCTYAGKTVRGEFDVNTNVWTIDGQRLPAGNLRAGYIEDLVMEDTAKTLAQDALEELRRRQP